MHNEVLTSAEPTPASPFSGLSAKEDSVQACSHIVYITPMSYACHCIMVCKGHSYLAYKID